MKWIDLHVHSTYSDGTFTPEQLVQNAFNIGLSAFALTDHDTTSGIQEAVQIGKQYGIEVIPGIEFSTDYQGQNVHIVGLIPNWQNKEFQVKLMKFQNSRLIRNQKMIDLLAADHFDISYDQMKENFGDSMWTRANFARYLIEHGYAESVSDAFTRLIGKGCKYYVPRQKISPFEVTALIREYGGIPILAHPFQYHFSEEELRSFLSELIPYGLLGMEVFYSTYSNDQMNSLTQIAAELNLCPSGGSDFHGENKPHISLGTGTDNIHIPYNILSNLITRSQEVSTHEI